MKRWSITLLAILLTFATLDVQSRGLHFGITSAVKDKVKELVAVREERIKQEAIPTINITAPANSAAVTGIIIIAVDANSHKGISKVELYIDGTLKAKYTTAPYAYYWDTAQYSARLHTIKAIAYDTANHTASAQHTVTSYLIASGWQNGLVDSVGGTASGTSLALDRNNNPQIAYAFANEDWTQSDLKYAQWTGSSWQVTTIDSSGAVGWWASLVLDSNNNPGIAYYDATSSDLKYAKKTGTSWEIT
ncbi:MAG: Ig-like domain-containing protein, partial [bacterium]|nr:Ig-like domain-containing protein [bacterium]